MKLTFGFLLFPGVQQLDLTGPYEVFASLPDARMYLVWKDLVPVRSSTGLTLVPTVDFSACPPLDVLCIPGGVGINALLTDIETLDFIRTRGGSARYLVSVCTGALLLGAAGFLKGRRATTHWAAHDLLSAFEAIPSAGRVVRDGPVFTCGGVTSGIDLSLSLLAEIAGQETAEVVQLCLEYAPDPPFMAGSPETASPGIVAMARKRLAALREERESIIRSLRG